MLVFRGVAPFLGCFNGLAHQVKIVHKDVPYEVPGTPKIIPVKLPQQVGSVKEVPIRHIFSRKNDP